MVLEIGESLAVRRWGAKAGSWVGFGVGASRSDWQCGSWLGHLPFTQLGVVAQEAPDSTACTVGCSDWVGDCWLPQQLRNSWLSRLAHCRASRPRQRC